MSNGDCAQGASNEARITGLEDNLAAFRQDFANLRKTIEQALKRPGWPTTVLLSILSSACVGLGVALVSVLRNSGV